MDSLAVRVPALLSHEGGKHSNVQKITYNILELYKR